ncbi:hypothetical protein [Moraxella lacunata]|uniref:hypothetical protein n=1 Tax=Moraxella lacunata TaxID=477 RepID=UPI003EDF20EE
MTDVKLAHPVSMMTNFIKNPYKFGFNSKSMPLRKPFVVSLSNHDGFLSPFDKLRANGKPSSAYFLSQYYKLYNKPLELGNSLPSILIH